MLRWAVAVILVVVSAGDASPAKSASKAKRQLSVETENTAIEVFNKCKCVYYYQCDVNNSIITNGETLITERINEVVTRIPCKGGDFPTEKVCCKLNGVSPDDIDKLLIELKNPSEDVDVIKPNGNKGDANADLLDDSEEDEFTCGVPKTILLSRIFSNDSDLNPLDGEFPWIAAIFENTKGDYKFHCSGSLIHPRVILTASHCVLRIPANKLKVVVNGKTKLSSIGINPQEEASVVEVVNHPNYNTSSLRNDAALLFLDKPFKSTKTNYIHPICLPPENVDLENTRCVVAGWGKSKDGKNNQVMKKVDLPYVNNTQCQKLLRKTRLGQHFSLHKSFMCAGGEKGRDACEGDGGSPLMCSLPRDKNRSFQIGIVSWGIGCGDENVPGVYGNVQHVAKWIRKELTDRQLTI